MVRAIPGARVSCGRTIPHGAELHAIAALSSKVQNEGVDLRGRLNGAFL